VKAIVAGTIAALALACVVMLRRATPAPAPAPTAPVQVEVTPIVTSAAAPPLAPPPPPPPGTDAEHAVEMQLHLIADGDLDALRATFTPEIRTRVTADVLAACRVRVRQVPVRPDWEMATDEIDEHGQRVRRVSMFGKSLTGFHEQPDGRWLADALWCVPVGLP
jgi:hypothetical protein